MLSINLLNFNVVSREPNKLNNYVRATEIGIEREQSEEKTSGSKLACIAKINHKISKADIELEAEIQGLFDYLWPEPYQAKINGLRLSNLYV